LSNNDSIHGLLRGWVVKLERGGGDAVVTHNIGPQIVRVAHAVHTAVFVGDSFGATSAKE
jgi:hypothetical protein